MTFIITDPCIDTLDKSCVDVCPVDCIHHEDGVDKKLFIDPDTCIDCGACEPACPVTAIYPDEDSVPESQKAFIEADKVWYQGEAGKAKARAIVDEHIATSPLMKIPADKRQKAHGS